MIELEREPDTDYPVFVTERDGVYKLCIRELILVVRGRHLQKAYEQLVARKREIIDLARVLGTLDELPQADRSALFRPAVLGPAVDRPHTLFDRVLSTRR